MMKWFRIARHERGLLFRGRDFVKVLKPGFHVFLDPLLRLRVAVEDVTQARLADERLDVIVAAGGLGDEARVVDLVDGQRGLVWVDGRLDSVLVPGRHAFWTVLRDVRVEVLDATTVRVDTAALAKLLTLPSTAALVDRVDVDFGSVGLFYLNGRFVETLLPGRYAFWKGEGRVEVRHVDLREQVMDVSGQEIMTADKVTLRLNAVLTYRVKDAVGSVTATADYVQSTYRDVQLALRAVVGTKGLDALLAEKDAVVAELETIVKPRIEASGLELVAFGIRDVILPGEMKDLLNKVTEARKAAEANLVTRREEVAAVRSQLNAARLIESNPTLMRLRELEVLEKVTERANLNVVLGDSGLADKVIKLL